jgi:8-oxo-dGTP pyrophosphatase MutT (NUDIX family)
VSYFVPFDPGSSSVLLAAHRKSGLVLPPGGHCARGELPWYTVQRECAEELGITPAEVPWLEVTVADCHLSMVDAQCHLVP